jgi:hypothetical protein
MHGADLVVFIIDVAKRCFPDSTRGSIFTFIFIVKRLLQEVLHDHHVALANIVGT